MILLLARVGKASVCATWGKAAVWMGNGKHVQRRFFPSKSSVIPPTTIAMARQMKMHRQDAAVMSASVKWVSETVREASFEKFEEFVEFDEFDELDELDE